MGGINVSMVLQALKALKPLWTNADDIPAFGKRLDTMWAQLTERMREGMRHALSNSGTDEGVKTVVRLVHMVAAVDTAKKELQSSVSGTTKALEETLRIQAVEALIEHAQKELDPSLDGDIVLRLESIIPTLLNETESGEREEEACIECARAADAALAAVSKPAVLLAKTREAVPRAKVFRHLATCDDELGKDEGSNTKLVLECVQHIGQMWKDLKDAQEEKDRTISVCEKIARRMRDAMQKAVEAKDKAKVQGLVKFAQEFDKACAPMDVRKTNLCDELKAMAKDSAARGSS